MPTLKLEYIFNRLNKPCLSEDQLAPIHLRILIEKPYGFFHTKVRIPFSEWDAEKNFIKNKSPYHQQYSDLLLSYKDKARKYHNKNIVLERARLSSIDIRNYLNEVRDGKTRERKLVLDYIKKEIKDNHDLEPTTKKNYRSVVFHLSSYNKKLELREVNRKEMINFLNHLKTKEKKTGGKLANLSIATIFSNLKGLMKSAIIEELIPSNAFYKITVKRDVKKKKEWLSFDKILKIHNLDLSKRTKKVNIIRDAYIFQCCVGIRVSDLIKNHKDERGKYEGLQLKHLKETKKGLILTKRPKKTRKYNKEINLNLDKLFGGLPADIARKYMKGKQQEDFLFIDFINLRYFNLVIKGLCKDLGFEENVTSHVARHSAAMNLLNAGMSIEEVSKILTHFNISTTQIYAKILDDTVNDSLDRIAHKFKKK